MSTMRAQLHRDLSGLYLCQRVSFVEVMAVQRHSVPHDPSVIEDVLSNAPICLAVISSPTKAMSNILDQRGLFLAEGAGCDGKGWRSLPLFDTRTC